MLFNSYIFLFAMLPATLVLYYGLNKCKKYQLALVSLLGMSLWFYGYFNPSYLLILCASILINWFLSVAMHKTERKKPFLYAGLVFNIGLIFYFKYFDFFINNLNAVFSGHLPLMNILLPLGISFFTFQQISYIADSYYGKTSSYRFLEYAVFVSFFPQLIAGPIVLHDELIPQLTDKNKKKFDFEFFSKGLYLFSIGLFKKVIVADTLAIIVADLWGGATSEFTSMSAWIAALAYVFQLYYDFSGYSDMAIGLGNLFNLTLPINFNSPYKACSISEFWERWHITLSRFLRQYIYFPLGGSKKGKVRTYINFFMVFFVSGLWHGANWTFIMWGILQGIANTIEKFCWPWIKKLPRPLRWFNTFTFFIFSVMIFNAQSLAQGFSIIQKMVVIKNLSIGEPFMTDYVLPKISFLLPLATQFNISENTLGLLFFAVIFFFITTVTIKAKNIHEKPFKPTYLNAFITVAAYLVSVVSLSTFSTVLYFNF